MASKTTRSGGGTSRPHRCEWFWKPRGVRPSRNRRIPGPEPAIPPHVVSNQSTLGRPLPHALSQTVRLRVVALSLVVLLFPLCFRNIFAFFGGLRFRGVRPALSRQGRSLARALLQHVHQEGPKTPLP